VIFHTYVNRESHCTCEYLLFEKDDYDSENSWISEGLPIRSRRRTILVVNEVVMGPLEEEETSITSEIVKAGGGQHEKVRRRFSIVGVCCLVSMRNPLTVTIPQCWFNKTKQHTHTRFEDEYRTFQNSRHE